MKIVRIGITLPNTVNIYIEELEVVYAAQDEKDAWWLLTSSGRVVENVTASKAKEKTLLEGFRIQTPGAVGDDAYAAEMPKDENETQSIVTDQERMDTALSIVSDLERKGVLDKVTVVDVTDLGNIQLQYGTGCQILLGNISQMENKLSSVFNAIRTREAAGEVMRGTWDATFEVYDEGVSFKPAD